MKKRKRKRSGADRLRLIVSNMDRVDESFNQRFKLADLIAIYLAYLESEWDFLPDEWNPRQVREAINGHVPRWDDDQVPIYAGEKG